jgi:hypothetical protein
MKMEAANGCFEARPEAWRHPSSPMRDRHVELEIEMQ